MKKIISAIIATSLVFCLTTATFANTASQDFKVTTNGDVTLNVQPDVAYISLGITTTGDTTVKASEQNSKNTQKVLTALSENGVKDDEVVTEYYSVYPNYDYTKEVPKVVGYTVNHTLKVTVKDINKVGEILDLGLNNGANNNSGVTFDVLNKDVYYAKALNEALTKAITKGNALASAVGVTNPNVVSINENSSYYSPVTYLANESMKSSDSTQIKNNTVSIYASVNVTLGK